MSGYPQQEEDSPTLNEFKHRLQHEWTRSVACQNECDPPESCSCQRHIVHVDALKAWWTRQASEGTNQTKLLRMLDEMQLPKHRTFPFNAQKLFTGDHSCLRIFSLLLKQGRGHLVDRFFDAGMSDIYLDRNDVDLRLHDSLVDIAHRDQRDDVIRSFHQDKWAHCPLELSLDMGRNLQGTKTIPPFCHKIKLGDKGGTASIYWVAIQEDLISDDKLRNAIHDSLYEDEDFGMVSCSNEHKFKDADSSLVLPNGSQIVLWEQEARLRLGTRGFLRSETYERSAHRALPRMLHA